MEVNQITWKKEIDRFINDVIIEKHLTSIEKEVLDFDMPYRKVISFIEKIAKEKNDFFTAEILYHDNMTGLEYEILCKSILINKGWEVEITKKVGDQGVDLLAIKNKKRIAIQCKKYASNVGNSAVQEVIAGKNYYKASHAVVVSNAAYTRAAKELAQINQVKLIHHNELLSDDFFLINRLA